MNSFAIGQIIRNFPLPPNGWYETYKLEGFDGEQVIVRNTVGICEEERWYRADVELFTFTGNCGSYSIGDTVRALGYEGTFTVQHFATDYRSSTQAEWGAALIHEDGSRLFYPAHLVKKA